MNPEAKGHLEPRDPMGKRWSPKGTSAGLEPFGSPAPPRPAEGQERSDQTTLEFAHRTALALRETFPDQILQVIHYRKEWTVVTKPERILDLMRFLRDSWGYAMCHDVTSVDLYPAEPRFMAVYDLLNMDQPVRFRVKCPLPGEKPEIDSVVPVWTGADYAEREVYDLMGIRFRGHPDLRRILMPDETDYHPLRKDFPLTGFPVGIDAHKD